MSQRLVGMYGFSLATKAELWQLAQGYRVSVYLYREDAVSGKDEHRSFRGETVEEAADKALEWMAAQMIVRPTLVKTYRGSEPFPGNAWDVDKAAGMTAFNALDSF